MATDQNLTQTIGEQMKSLFKSPSTTPYSLQSAATGTGNEEAITDVESEVGPLLTIPATKFTPKFDLLGAGFTTKRTPVVDFKLVDPTASITEVLPFDDEEYKKTFMSFSAVENAQGEELDLSGMPIEQRIEQADKFGATKMVAYVEGSRETYEIPWEDLVTKRTRFPEEIKMGPQRIDITNLSYDEYRNLFMANRLFSTLASPSPELGRAIHAQYINEVLISNGVDARSRAIIINNEIDNIGLNQFSRIIGNSTEGLARTFGETALWAVGEVSDIVGSSFGADMSGTIADYKTREGIMQGAWKSNIHRVQDYFAANENVIIDLQTAEDLVRAHTGLIPYAVQLAAEFVAPSKAATARQAFTSVREYRAFNQFKKGEIETRPDVSDAALLEEWKELRKTRYLGLGGLINYDNRIVLAFQIEDSAMPVAQRAEVRNQVELLGRLAKNRDAAFERRAAVKKSDNQAAIMKANDDVAAATLEFEQASHALKAIQRRSAIPKFIRDQGVQDKYLLAGAASLGFLFDNPESEISPEFGEIIGIGAGLTVYLLQGKGIPALQALSHRLTKDQEKKLRFATTKIIQQDPAIQMVVEHQAKKIGELKTVLTDAGVSPDVLDTPLDVVTNLVVLRHFADATLTRVSVGKTLESQTVKELQALADINRRLNGELNRIISDLPEGSDPDGELVRMLTYFRKESQKGFDELNGYIDTAEKEAVGYYLNTVNGNAAAVADKSPLTNNSEKVQSFPDALDALHNNSLARLEALPEDNFKQIIDEHDEIVNETILTKATEIMSRTGTTATVREGVQGPLMTRNNDLPSNVTAGGLFSFFLENAHASAKAKASYPYRMLDGQLTFQTTAGVQVPAGSLSVKIGDLFESVLDTETEFIALQRSLGRDLKAADVAAMNKVLVEVSDPFFESMANKNGVTKEKFIKGLADELEGRKPPVNLPKNKNERQVAIAQQLLKEDGLGDAPVLNVSFSQLREIQRSIGGLRYKYRGDKSASGKLEAIDDLIDAKMEEFTLPDGTPAGQLQIVTPDGKTQSVSEYLNEANKNYSEYKKAWYDTSENAVIPMLMSWGNRVDDDVTGTNPSGIRYAKRTEEWLDVASFADEVQAGRLVDSLTRALGRPILLPSGTVERKLVLGDQNVETVRAALGAAIGEFVVKNLGKGGMGADDLRKFILDVEYNFRKQTVDATGKQMPLLNVVDIVDEVIAPGPNSYGKAVWDEARKSVVKKIESAVDDAIEPAKIRRKELDHAIKFLSRYYGEDATLESVGKRLADGSASDVRQLRNILQTSKNVNGSVYSDDEIDKILENAYIAYASKTVFQPTGRTYAKTDFSKDGKETLAVRPEFVEDVVSMNKMLGDTPDRREVVKMLIGERRYKVWTAVASFMSEALDNNPLSRNSRVMMQGAPRSLSVESYISRLYAINRGVVRPQYVGTEATLQALRNRNFNFLQAVLTDPELGNLFVDMVQTGKPLTGEKNLRFEALLLQSYAQQAQSEGEIKEVNIVDPATRSFTVHATGPEKVRMGFAADTPAGQELTFPDLPTQKTITGE